MNPRDALFEALRALGDVAVPADEVAIRVPGSAEEAEEEARFRLTAGAFDLLIDRALAEGGDDASREALLRDALAEVCAIEPVLSYTLSERSREAEQLERAARMRGRQNRLADGWLVPRLREEIAMYEARIRALESAIEEAPR